MSTLDSLFWLMSTPNPVSLVIVFTFGTFVGSFINVCIGRLPIGKSIVWPGSACTSCGVPLQWWQNVPVISYIVLGARCYRCGSAISVRYLLMEVLTGGIAVAVFLSFGGPVYSFFYYLLFSCILVIVFFVDLDAWIILDEVSYFGIASGIVGAWWLPAQSQAAVLLPWMERLSVGVANVLEAICGAAFGFAIFYGIAVVGAICARQEALGRGDVKFAALICAFLGPKQGLIALVLAFPLGAVFALPLILWRGKSGKTPIPFGTFMAVAAFGMVVAGQHVDAFQFPWTVPLM